MKKDKLDKIVQAGRTDEEMLRERMTAGPRPEDMVFSPLGGPYPRLLPDGRVIKDPDAIREVADMSDEEAMAWLDIPDLTETDQ